MIDKLLKGKGRLIVMIGAAVTGVLLLLAGSGWSDKDTGSVTGNTMDDIIKYTARLEDRIEKFLETVNGIDSAKVYITVDGTEESEYAKDGHDDYLLIDNKEGESAAVVRVVYPKIRGIAISCTGGDSARVKEKITDLLSAALGISANKIQVTGQS